MANSSFETQLDVLNKNLKVDGVGKVYISRKAFYLKAYDIIRRLSKNGGGGIRTHGALADTLVFKTRALNHSTTLPGKNY